MADYTRQPPRFVPTLTEVVPVEQLEPTAPEVDVVSDPAAEALATSAAAEIVAAVPADGEAVAAIQAPETPLPVAPAPIPEQLLTPERVDEVAERLAAQLMQRVEVLLEERLRYALAEMVQVQTQALVVQLRREVETVVRQSVDDAVAEELVRARRASLKPV